MEKYTAPTKFLQFQLWHDCSNGCKFCCNKGQKDINKIEALNFILNKLNDQNEIAKFDEIGFIGGEFFNNEIESKEVKDLFYSIFKKITTLSFKKVYFTTSLLFNIDLYLIPFIEYLKDLNILNKCLLCTSYDFAYRFNKPGKKELWINNMQLLQKNYPELNLHTEIILMQPFIDAVNNNTFSIKEFKKEFNTEIDYIEPSSGMYYTDKIEASKDLPNFFPTKKSFIKFIIKCLKNKDININTFLSMELRSSKLYYIDGGTYQLVDNRRNTDGRGHPLDKTKKYEIGFIDSEDTMLNIAKQLFKTVE